MHIFSITPFLIFSFVFYYSLKYNHIINQNKYTIWKNEFFSCFYFTWVSLHLHGYLSTMWVTGATEAGRGQKISCKWSYRWLWVSMQVLENELESSTKAVNTLNYLVISPAANNEIFNGLD